jgi:3-hydroxymyristoyl/3-hydroxydecanoyl-(acyl carrier protein) dehydratase
MGPADELSSISRTEAPHFESGPQEESWDQNDTVLTLRGVVPENLFHLSGHFPENPIVPGFVLVSWALGAIERAFKRKVEFIGMRHIKFRQALRPGSAFLLRAELGDSAANRRQAVFTFATPPALGGASATSSATNICSGVIEYE